MKQKLLTKKDAQTSVQSYDLFERKADVYRYHFFVESSRDSRYPLCPFFVSDLTRWDGDWIQHVNYPHLSIEMVLDGAIKYSNDVREITVPAGGVFLIVPHSNVKIVNADPGKARRKLALLVSGISLSGICQALGFFEEDWIRLTNPAEIEKLMRKIGVLLKKNDLGRASDATYSLLRRLSEEKSRDARQERDGVLNELVLYINNHLSSHLTVEDMAAFQRCSVSTLQRHFKKYYSVTPLTFLCNLRLELAQTLLETTRTSIKEISFQCGFSSPLYFGQAFRNKFHISPSCFRKQSKLRLSAASAEQKG